MRPFDGYTFYNGWLHFPPRFVLPKLDPTLAPFRIDAHGDDIDRIVGLLEPGGGRQCIRLFRRQGLGISAACGCFDRSGSSHVSELPRFPWTEFGLGDDTEVQAQLVLGIGCRLMRFTAANLRSAASGPKDRLMGLKFEAQAADICIQNVRGALAKGSSGRLAVFALPNEKMAPWRSSSRLLRVRDRRSIGES
jgi:hypothetical protein